MNKLLFTVLMSASIAAFANDTSFNQCMNQSGGVTVDMLDCIAAEAKFQDTRLNTNYKKAMSLLSGSKKQELLSSQRLWLKQRGDTCDAAMDKDGGTAEALILNDCYLQEITKRADYLEEVSKKAAQK